MDTFIPICSAVLCGTVWYSALQTEWKFLCSNRASSSKKWLGNSDISNLLNSGDIIDKLLDADECSDKDKSNDTDFGEQENYVLLLDVGDNSGEVDAAYVSNTNFLWEDVDSYIRPQIRQLKGKHKQIALQWIPGHCQITGNEQADLLAKKGAKITHISEKHPTTLLNYI